MSVEALPEYRRKSRFGLYIKNLKGEWENVGNGRRTNRGGQIPRNALVAMQPSRPDIQFPKRPNQKPIGQARPKSGMRDAFGKQMRYNYDPTPTPRRRSLREEK